MHFAGCLPIEQYTIFVFALCNKIKGSATGFRAICIVNENDAILTKIRFRYLKSLQLILIAMQAIVNVKADRSIMNFSEVLLIIHLVKRMVVALVFIKSYWKMFALATIGFVRKVIDPYASLIGVIDHAAQKSEAVPHAYIYERLIFWHQRNTPVNNCSHGKGGHFRNLAEIIQGPFHVPVFLK